MDDAVQAIMMTFAVLVFVIALSISMMLIKQARSTSEILVQYSDLTAFYDNIQFDGEAEETERIVGLDTVIPTLYRYYKENFCVKIYDVIPSGATNIKDEDYLLQIFDVNIETNLRTAISNTNAGTNNANKELVRDDALKEIYDDSRTRYCLYGAPWLGSTETIKQRIDFFINGNAGYINNTYLDYSGDDMFAKKIADNPNIRFKERFISYSYSGSTVTTDEGETLINDSKNKDKIVIIYTILDTPVAGTPEDTP